MVITITVSLIVCSFVGQVTLANSIFASFKKTTGDTAIRGVYHKSPLFVKKIAM